MGITKDRVLKIPVDENFRVRVDLLKESYRKAEREGKKVFCIIASAPSTSTGTYDNLEEIGKFCHAEGVWFHADGAHGVPAIFSKKYKHLVKGIEYADSIVMDFHKMMLTPGISTALLLKTGRMRSILSVRKPNTCGKSRILNGSMEVKALLNVPRV